MPIPISKVKDTMVESQTSIDLSILPLLKLPTSFILLNSVNNKADREAIKKVWLHSDDEGGKMRIKADVSKQDISLLQSKGYLKTEGDAFEFTTAGKDLLKKSILDDEKSALTKTASKKMMAKNSYDFGDEVLVKVNHPERFGTRYLSISRIAFNKKGMIPRSPEYNFATAKSDGSKKQLGDYTDQELVLRKRPLKTHLK
jgi:hypothetical protein